MQPADRDAQWQALCDQVQTLMREHGVPGVAIGLLIDGQEYRQGFGVTSVTNPLPVTAETLFQIGSATKTITATALMRLVERGAVDLGAPVRQYLPDFRVADEATAAAVTVANLLSHTAGWYGDALEETGAGDDALARNVERMATLPQKAPLGELFSYNNAALNVAGRVIEVVTGKTYEAAVKELVLAPLGMTSSSFFPTEVMVRRFAVGHMSRDGAPVLAEPWNLPRSTNPAGGLVSTAGDLLRYARFHMGDGRTESGEVLLSPTAMRRMQTPVVAAQGGDQMGLTWFIQEEGGVRFLLHGGATNGQRSLFWIAPEHGMAVTMMTNHAQGRALNEQLSAWVRREYLGVSTPEPVPLPLSPEELRGYEGRYTDVEWAAVVKLEGDHLRLHFEGNEPGSDPLPPASIGLIARDRLVVLDGPLKGARGEFLQSLDGRRWLRITLRLHERTC